jgi:glycosyltransferase involved in cell wall biosynthesis
MCDSFNKVVLKISVIIAVYDGVDSIENAINSVLKQNYSAIELLVIDGGSKDGTLEVIEKYLDHISFFETGQDSGISDAFNRGVIQSTGDVIVILNSDDYWESGAVHEVVRLFNENPGIDIVHGRIRYIDSLRQSSYIKTPCINDMKKYMSVYHPTMFAKRKAYDSVGLYNEHYMCAMDSEWVHRALSKKIQFLASHEVLSNMALGGRSDTEFKQALTEYRQSVITHKIANKPYAYAYYGLHLLMKYLVKISILRQLKQKIDRYINDTFVMDE